MTRKVIQSAVRLQRVWRLLQIVGSSLGVFAAHSVGEENQPFQHAAYLLVLSVGAASATTATCTWLVGDILQNVSVTYGIIGAMTNCCMNVSLLTCTRTPRRIAKRSVLHT